MNNKVIDKIRKLIKLEESATKVGSIAEAANAAEKIRLLLQEHNLEMAQISLKEPSKEEEIINAMSTLESLTKRNEGDWVRLLVHTISHHNNCRAIFSSSDKTKVALVGTQTNVDVSWYTVEQLINRIRPMAREHWSKYNGLEKKNTFLRGFYIGVVKGINEKLKEEKAKEVDKARQGDNHSVMVVDYDKKMMERVNQFVSQTIGRTGTSKTGRTSSTSGYNQGKEAGRNMGIHGGLSGTSRGRKMIG